MSDSATVVTSESPIKVGATITKPAIVELVVGPLSGHNHLLVKADMEDLEVIQVPTQTDEIVRIKTIEHLHQPWGVAVNQKGEVIVVEGRDLEGDKHLCRVSIYTPQGKKMTHFGCKGAGDGEFHAPRGVAVDNEDNIYVVDKENARIQKFSPDYEFITSVGSKGKGHLQFNWSKGIGVHPHTKNIYVADTENHRVQILTPDFKFLSKIGAVDTNGQPRKGKGDGEFNDPFGVAFDKSGRVYITDYANDRIQVFTEEGKYIGKFGTKGEGEGELKFPAVVCIDENDILYVTETGNSRVSVFKIEQHTNVPVASSSGGGAPSASTHSPLKSKYTPPLFIRTFGHRPDSQYQGGIAVSKQGIVYLTDDSHDDMQIFVV